MSQSPWRVLFLNLSLIERPIIAFWQMSNGAEFWLRIPNRDEIAEDTFVSHVEFPFRFDEILKITIQRRIGKEMGGFENPLEQIKSHLARVPDLCVTIQPDRIDIVSDSPLHPQME